MSSRFVLSVDDLDDVRVRRVLDRARYYRCSKRQTESSHGRILGLVFLEASLRTRVGFAAAALRLGWQPISVTEHRASPTSKPESWQDTLRTVAGYVDAVVARVGQPLVREELSRWLTKPLINGGDAGPEAEHPSQALIDMFSIERAGPPAELCIGICGDLRMRAVRSLLRLLARTPPRRVALLTEPPLAAGAIPASLAPVVEQREPWELCDVDVLYVAGIPYGALSEPGRSRLRLGQAAMAALPRDAIVLCPLPVIDEIDEAVRNDARLRMFEQSDDGLFVRMALLKELVAST